MYSVELNTISLDMIQRNHGNVKTISCQNTGSKVSGLAGISTTPPVEIRIRVFSTQGVCKPCLVLISTPPPAYKKL